MVLLVSSNSQCKDSAAYPVDLKINLEVNLPTPGIAKISLAVIHLSSFPKVIALARLNRLNEALALSNEIFNLNFQVSQTFMGRVYPMTVSFSSSSFQFCHSKFNFLGYFRLFAFNKEFATGCPVPIFGFGRSFLFHRNLHDHERTLSWQS